MKKNRLLIAVLLQASLVAQAQTGKQSHTVKGTWLSQGQIESRKFTLHEDGNGEFLSEHQGKRCLALLETLVDGQFIMDSGVAHNCQMKNNAVAFEFYCQQTSINTLSCKIRSTHKKTGKSKQGVENFTRQQ